MGLFMVDINGTSAGDLVTIPPGFAISRKARRVKGYALTGSAAAEDAEIAVKYGANEIFRCKNTDTDDVPDKQEMQYNSSNFILKPYTPLEIEVTDAAGSAAYALILIQNLGRRRR